MFALLGGTRKTPALQNYPDNLYAIESFYNHPNYQFPDHNDVGLYKLETAIELSPTLRPACIYTFGNDHINERLEIVSWGNIYTCKL